MSLTRETDIALNITNADDAHVAAIRGSRTNRCQEKGEGRTKNQAGKIAKIHVPPPKGTQATA